MVLGNGLTGISLGLERCLTSFDEERASIELWISAGARPWESARPTAAKALRAGLIPILNAMSVAGLVTIPGMMTGQILGGTEPGLAARYQIMVMFLIAGATAAGTTGVVVGAPRPGYRDPMGCVTGLRCVVCGQEAPAPESVGTCPRCADPSATLEVEFDLERVARTLTREALAQRPRSHWRYAELLPIEPDEAAFRWPIGCTPLLDAPRLARWAGLERLRLKDDSRNPTASFKDRASSVGVLHALQRGATRIACASTGNAASSLAGFAAMAGLGATIFVPQTAPEPKLAQLLIYGADVRRVRGTYAQAYELCSAECEARGWYNRNCAINPYLVEGKKTCGLELAEETATRPADWVAVSVGDGCTIAGIGRGLEQMRRLGFIERLPRLLGVQAAGVHPLQAAFESGELPGPDSPATGGTTMADSIDVPLPRNWRKAVLRVRESQGTLLHVSDDEIGAALCALGALAGVFAEPAAATAVAGVRRAVLDGIIGPRDEVVAVITGSGLKDIRNALRVAGRPRDVDPIGA